MRCGCNEHQTENESFPFHPLQPLVNFRFFAFRNPLYNSVFVTAITLLYRLTAFRFFFAGLVLSLLCLPQRFTASCLFASIAYCGNIIRLLHLIGSVVSFARVAPC